MGPAFACLCYIAVVHLAAPGEGEPCDEYGLQAARFSIRPCMYSIIFAHGKQSFEQMIKFRSKNIKTNDIGKT
jgi:pyruvate dehydrogenase complex dehydrogenase (E1) component